MIQQADGHLNVVWLTSDHDQSLTLVWRPSLSTSRTDTDCTRFHDFDLARTHLADLVDLGTTLADDAADQVVGYVNLLSLQGPSRSRRWRHSGLRIGVRVVCSRRSTGGNRVLVGAWRARLAVGKSDGTMGFLLLYENVPNVISRDMDSIRNS
jgi:hypothetical protein